MQRLSFLLIAFLSFFALESCKDVRLGADGVDASGGIGRGGGGGGAAGAGGTTSSAAGATATGGATSSAGGTTAFAAGTTATGGATSSPGGTTSSTGGTTVTTLVTGLNSPSSLVVDATSVYFINGGTAANNYVDGALMKVPTGGGKTTTVVSGQSPSGLAIAGTNLYWTNYGTFVSASTNYTLNTVMTVPISGGDPAPLVSGQTGSVGPESVAVDATNVYWTNSTGTVMKLSLGGGTPITLASGLDFPGSIAVDATNVYWMNQGTSGRADGYARLMTVPIKGGTPTTLASADRMASGGIAVDATSVYWAYYIYDSDNAAPGGTSTPDGGTAGCAGTVLKVPVGGGTPITLASGQFCSGGQVAVDATAVYWVNGGLQANGYTDGAVMALPLAGGTPIAVAAMQNTNGGLAIDATSVYWTIGGTADGDGAVLKAPKIAFGGAGGSGGANGGTTGTGGVSGGSTGTTGGTTSSLDAGVGNSCDNPLPLKCGDRLNHSTLVQGRANVWGGYGLTQRAESGREAIYAMQTTASCQVVAQLKNLTVDLDLFALSSCSEWSDTAASSTPLDLQTIESVRFATQAGQPYFVVVDGYNGAAGTYTLEVDCACDQDAGTIDAPPADAQGDAGIAPGCDLDVASKAMASLGLISSGVPQTSDVTLPAGLMGGGWDVKASMCQQGGYDITPLAGKTACLLLQDITQTCDGNPSRVGILMDNGAVSCVFKAARSDFGAPPGVYPANYAGCAPPTIAVGADVACEGTICTVSSGPCCPSTTTMNRLGMCGSNCLPAAITCDGPEDCSNGNVCCSLESATTGFAGAYCVGAAACTAPSRLICHRPADCPGSQKCAVPNPVPAYVSTSPYPASADFLVSFQVCAP